MLCAMPAFSADAGPELRSWVMTASANAAVRTIAPEVHSVHADDQFVYVTSAGLSLHSFGSLEANQFEAPLGPRVLSFRIPRNPKSASGAHLSAPLGVIGVFATGVPIYNPIGAISYQDQNIWHQDAVAAAAARTSPLLSALTKDAGRHSPIIGFALDGYPIYGPFGWDPAGDVRRMKSSYQLRHISRRTTLPDGTILTPAQEQEIARFHDLLPKVHAAITGIRATFAPRMEEYAKRLMASNWRPATTDMEAQKQRRLDAVDRAERMVAEACK